MPPLGLVEGRNTHQPMNPNFTGQKAEGILAVYRERRRLQARFFARLVIIEHSLESLALRPTQIHAQQHVGPVLRLSAASPRMDGQDSVARVIFAGEQGGSFQL